jgi:hypothetical protein
VFGLFDALGWIRPPEPDGAGRRPDPPAGIDDAFRAATVDIVGRDAPMLRVPAAELAHVLCLPTPQAPLHPSAPTTTEGQAC